MGLRMRHIYSGSRGQTQSLQQGLVVVVEGGGGGCGGGCGGGGGGGCLDVRAPAQPSLRPPPFTLNMASASTGLVSGTI